MKTDAFKVVRDFESALCEYTGASFAVTTNSCTMALLLAVKWHLSFRRPRATDLRGSNDIEIPKRTYISVPCSIIHAGGRPVFRDEAWKGRYRLKPLPVWDSARLFTGGMSAKKGLFMDCVSFHANKILGDTQGGAILHADPEADAWLRRMRFDGRTEGVAPKDDNFREIGYHCYMSPDVAARLLFKLHSLPKHNEPLPNDEYPDLSQMEVFR